MEISPDTGEKFSKNFFPTTTNFYQQYLFKDLTLNKYLKTWYSDDEGDAEPCNVKASSYCSNMAGSMIVNAIRKVVTNSPYETMLTFNFPTMTIQKNTCFPA